MLGCINYNQAQSYETLDEAFLQKDTLEYLTLFEGDIDDRIYQFEKLKELQLYNCNIDSLKEAILLMSNLRKVIIKNSDLSYVSKEVFRCSVVHIDLSENKLSDVNFPKGGAVNYLALSGNRVKLYDLEHLTKLKTLVLHSCELKLFPKGICNLAITTLDLSNNQIEKVPKCLFKLNEIKVLNLGTNRIRKFTDCFEKINSLERLNLSNNRISAFSKSYEFKSLRKLMLRGNDRLKIEDLNISSGYGEIKIN